jgi:hypothetical protein
MKPRDDMAEQIGSQAVLIRLLRAEVARLQAVIDARAIPPAPLDQRARAAEGWLDPAALREIAEAETHNPAPPLVDRLPSDAQMRWLFWSGWGLLGSAVAGLAWYLGAWG